MEQVLYAGFGRQNITPDYSVPLAGYGATSKRMSTCVLRDLYTTCIAFRYGEEIILWCTQDLCGADWGSYVRPLISNATGIPIDHIMISKNIGVLAFETILWNKTEQLSDHSAKYADVYLN